MGVIADLFVAVGADVRPFVAKMGEVNAKLEETSAKSGKFGGAIAGAGLLAAGAITGVAAFAAAAIAKTEEAGQAAFEMSEKFGLSGQQASAYMVVGKQLGLSNEQIGKGFQFLSKNVSGMALTLEAGGKISATTGQVYKDLGINVLDAGGKVKSADELMLEAADAFKGMKDGPEKAALSMKLFGKSGTDLLPMLNQGRAGIKGLMDAGKAQGDVMSNEQVEAAHKLFLAHKRLDTAIAGVTTQIGTVLMPIISGFIDFLITRAVPWIQNAVKTMSSWKGLWEGVGIAAGITFGIMKVGWGVLTTVIGAVKDLVGWIASLKGLWNALGNVFAITPFGFLVEHLTQVRNVIGWIVDRISDLISAVRNVIGWLNQIKVPSISLPFGIGGPQHHAVGGVALYTGLHWLEKGERVLNAQQQGASAGVGGGDMRETNALLREQNALLRAIVATPSGQTGVAAALYKAIQGAGMNRLRGMAGA